MHLSGRVLIGEEGIENLHWLAFSKRATVLYGRQVSLASLEFVLEIALLWLLLSLCQSGQGLKSVMRFCSATHFPGVRRLVIVYKAAGFTASLAYCWRCYSSGFAQKGAVSQ